MLFKGRFGLRQYVPSKRSRYGIKTYVACESSSGYAFNILSHQFSSELKNMEIRCDGNLMLSQKIVIYLCEHLLNQGYHIFIDNYFCSTSLAQFLLKKDTLMTGTIRQGRGVPALLVNKDVPPKTFECARKEDTLIAKFVDRKTSGKKTVYIIDTSGTAEEETHHRVLKGGVHDEVKRPTVIPLYNLNMGGVDMKDSAIHHYDASRKSYRWFVKYGIHLFQMLHHNSWIIYRKHGGKQSYLQYLEKTVQFLLSQTGVGRQGRSGGRLSQDGAATPKAIQHRLERLQPRGNQKHPAKRCRVCCKNGVRKETVFVCVGCPEQPGLCIGKCFREFHDK